MNRNRLAALVAVLSLAFTPGCYIYGDHYDPLPGDVTFSWSFDGLSCAQERQVETVRVIIPGESLENGGYYPCRLNGYDGITLHNFRGGTYNFELIAIDYSGYESFYRRGSFTVDGSINVRVDLDPQ